MIEVAIAFLRYGRAVAASLDPLCGPVGIFSLVSPSGMLSCGNLGWGDEIARGFWVTVACAFLTLPIGLLVGVSVALAKRSSDPLLSSAASLYTTLFRALPELLTLFIIYFGLQLALQGAVTWLGLDIKVQIDALFSGVCALAIVFSAYCAEVITAAFNAIPKGQYEAGYALGLPRYRTFKSVILPQLLRLSLPGLGNLWMNLLKDTSYVSTIGLADVLRQTGIAAKVTKDAFFFYGIACVIYLALAVLSAGVISRFGVILNRGQVR